ncbi:hypothetical protein ABIE44_002756 [Marmoricola sp. OAE513]|uniref:hypothetical protein n=1 Tax=Marmoricola sp. OAE513 TaxID=2817894 RepID=UPI001AE8B22B
MSTPELDAVQAIDAVLIDVDKDRILRHGSTAELVALVASDAVTWAELVDAGLPRGDLQVELAMLYRADCPQAFLRESDFRSNVLDDPRLPVTTARAILADKPMAMEIRRLGAARADLTRMELSRAAYDGFKRARWRGLGAEMYLALAQFGAGHLRIVVEDHEREVVGMLRNPICPEPIVLEHVMSRRARVRYFALKAIQERDLAIDSTWIRGARDLPMSERRNTTTPYTARVKKLADEILEAR